MKLFTLGPVEMFPSTRMIHEKKFPYFRTEEYGKVVRKTLARLSQHIGLKEDNALIYMACSGTAAMEATVENCVNTHEKILVINGGTFGKRFCELFEYHQIQYESIDLKWNEILKEEHLKPYSDKGFTSLFVNLHETSTGQLYDIELISSFCKRNGMYLIVDAISTFLVDDYDMDRYAIDVTIISSQKGLCLSPGMSMIALSKRMIDKILTPPPLSPLTHNLKNTFYFDIKKYLLNITRGQTPFTPPVSIMYELEDILYLIEKKGGKNAWLIDIFEKCQYFRKRAIEYGFEIPSYPLSNMLTPLVFHDINAYSVFEILKDRYKFYVCPVGGELSHKLLRISHIGNTSKEDIDILLDKLSLSVSAVKGAGK